MTRFTSPVALAAVCLGLLIPATVTSAQAANPAEPLRACQGHITTLGWGAIVRDRNGRCTNVEASRHSALPRAAAQAETMTCKNARSYLGGALQVCNDRPLRRAPR